MFMLHQFLVMKIIIFFILIKSNAHGTMRGFLEKMKITKGKNYNPGIAIILNSYMNVQFYGKISLGTPKEGGEEQWFYAAMDSGSSDLWVPSIDSCAAAASNCVNQRAFDPSKSSTFHGLKDVFSKIYGDGTRVQGRLAIDTLKIGTLKVPNIRFGLSTGIQKAHMKCDGILGLGLGAGSGFPGNSKSAIEQITEQTNIKPQFGIALHDRDSEGNRMGHLFIGGYDRSLVDGKFTVAQVLREYFSTKLWAVSLDGLSVGDKILPLSRGMKMIVDSGASIISMPQRLLNDILKAMPEKEKQLFTNHKIFPCSNVDLNSLPNVSFIITRKPFTLTPADYIEELYSSSEGGSCVLALSAHSMFSILLGDTFIRKYYVRYDLDKKEIAFAKIKKINLENQKSQGDKLDENDKVVSPTENEKDSYTVVNIPIEDDDDHTQEETSNHENPTKSDSYHEEVHGDNSQNHNIPIEDSIDTTTQPVDHATNEGEDNNERKTKYASDVEQVQDENRQEHTIPIDVTNKNIKQDEDSTAHEAMENKNKGNKYDSNTGEIQDENKPVDQTPIEDTNKGINQAAHTPNGGEDSNNRQTEDGSLTEESSSEGLSKNGKQGSDNPSNEEKDNNDRQIKDGSNVEGSQEYDMQNQPTTIGDSFKNNMQSDHTQNVQEESIDRQAKDDSSAGPYESNRQKRPTTIDDPFKNGKQSDHTPTVEKENNNNQYKDDSRIEDSYGYNRHPTTVEDSYNNEKQYVHTSNAEEEHNDRQNKDGSNYEASHEYNKDKMPPSIDDSFKNGQLSDHTSNVEEDTVDRHIKIDNTNGGSYEYNRLKHTTTFEDVFKNGKQSDHSINIEEGNNNRHTEDNSNNEQTHEYDRQKVPTTFEDLFKNGKQSDQIPNKKEDSKNSQTNFGSDIEGSQEYNNQEHPITLGGLFKIGTQSDHIPNAHENPKYNDHIEDHTPTGSINNNDEQYVNPVFNHGDNGKTEGQLYGASNQFNGRKTDSLNRDTLQRNYGPLKDDVKLLLHKENFNIANNPASLNPTIIFPLNNYRTPGHYPDLSTYSFSNYGALKPLVQDIDDYLPKKGPEVNTGSLNDNLKQNEDTENKNTGKPKLLRIDTRWYERINSG